MPLSYFPLQKLPDDLIENVFLEVMELETYKKLATIQLFQKYFQKYKFLLGVAANDPDVNSAYSGISTTVPSSYRFGYSQLPRFLLSHYLNSNWKTINFEDYKFVILKINYCLGIAHDSIDELTTILEAKRIYYFVEIESICLCLTQTFRCGQEWKNKFITPYLKGIYLNHKCVENVDGPLFELGVPTPRQLEDVSYNLNFEIHANTTLRRVVLTYSDPKLPKFINNSFNNAPLILLNIDISSLEQFKILKKFELTLKKAIITHDLDFDDEMLSIDSFKFSNLHTLIIKNKRDKSGLGFEDRLTINSSEFPELENFILETQCPANQALDIRHSIFPKLRYVETTPSTQFTNLTFINNEFPALECLPILSNLDQSIQLRNNFWPLISESRMTSDTQRNSKRKLDQLLYGESSDDDYDDEDDNDNDDDYDDDDDDDDALNEDEDLSDDSGFW